MRVQSKHFVALPVSCKNMLWTDPKLLLDSPVEAEADPMLGHYLIATWAKVCQALGPEFEPYLPVVMPPLLTAAAAKADLSVYGKYPFIYLLSLAADFVISIQTKMKLLKKKRDGKHCPWMVAKSESRLPPSKRSARRLKLSSSTVQH